MKKIVILGPESTGKTVLCHELCRHFDARCVEEYARQYLERTSGVYSKIDLREIAKGQIENEEAEFKSSNESVNNLVFIDTDITVIKIWSEYKFGSCDPWILEQYHKRNYDFYLLTYPDLSWHPDPLRENPEDREELFNIYLEDLISRGVKYGIIKGMGGLRTQNAIKVLQGFLEV